MAKTQKKTGKGRLDKYYKLAKEQGYRARSAFKLIQLNKKYSFLESARCCIDLCAAPGGWLQVASKYMPPNSIIVGVDLVPIKPIPRVVTFASDITTTQCRNLLRGELKDWKADVVLHDGAPNVGSAWVQDAYSQSELVLMSMKLACEFLAKGGTFVTKVFRSADYNNLIWAFKQLFAKVEATKPPSSRNVSAEIFVVCQDFIAPKHIDPKFFDPKHVFKELSAGAPLEGEKDTKNYQANVFQPEKKRRNRAGYDDGDYTLFKQAGAAEFIRTNDAVAFLGTFNKITFTTDEEKEWLTAEITTPDVKENCNDLKVLGKGDFKALIKWRTALREELGLEVKVKPTEELTETVEISEVVDPDQEIESELERLNAESAARQKRERRKANEQKTKTIQRMQLQMTAPLDIGLEQNDATLAYGQEDVFDLEHTTKALRNKGGISRLMDGDDDGSSESEKEEGDSDEDEEIMDEEEERDKKVAALENELDGLYDSYQERMKEKDAKYQAKKARNADSERGEWFGIAKQESDDGGDSDDGGYEKMQRAKARNDSDSDSDSNDSDDDGDPSQPESRKRRHNETLPQRKKARLDPQPSSSSLKHVLSRAAENWFSQEMFSALGEVDDAMEDDEPSEDEDEEMDDGGESEEDNDDDDFEVVPQDNDDDDDVDMWDVKGENEDEAKEERRRKHGLITPEAVTIAQQLVNREKTRTQLINDGFNRYSLNSKDDLPSWFLDDEGKHYKPNVPVTKEAIAALRAKMRALDARPIKKVAEAKARKKMRAVQRMEKAMKKAEGVNETSDMSEREKARQIEKLMGKSMAKAKKKEVKVVVAKGAHRGLKGRPKGVKGRYVMVDSRMKKEVRAQKRRDKASKKRKRS
ncbi:Spb1 C-terminal domain-containing protein [Cristinia sonorae]|uniref:Spb1 C-terminal domain-containing protein n=1 Tax=Cristinia sonorae TaxID=1940300 RepID=A0A8K0XRJ1_9AGAR|nr:Spb1 C-terminal domain-containing protein [Cristinia sonorae]